jgi:hypothetical protein
MNAYHIDILEPDPVYGLRSKEALKKCLREGEGFSACISTALK